MRGLWVLTVLGTAVVLTPPLEAQQEKARAPEGDRPLAGLVSKETAFYLEVRQPEAVADKLPELLRGSVLENYPFGLEKLRQQGTEPEAWMELLGLCLTPEGIKEARKIRGVAVAVRGPNATGGWDYVVLVRPGEGTVIPLMMRQHLAKEAAQPVDEVEGVAVYRCAATPGMVVAGGAMNAARMQREMQRRMMQQMQRMLRRQMPGAAINLQGDSAGTDFVMLPDLIVFGSPSLVKDAVVLLKGRGNVPALAETKDFADASKAFGNEPGVFLFGDLSVLEKQLGEGQFAWSGWLRHFVKGSVLTPVRGGLILDKDGLRVQLQTRTTDPKASPFLRCIAEAPANAQLFHFVPPRMEGAMALANPEGAERWHTLMEVCDAWVRSVHPAQQLPSKSIAELEGSLKLEFGKDVAGQIKHLLVAQGPERTDGSTPPLLGVFEAKDEETAKSLQDAALPKILEAICGEQIVPTVKEAKGRTVTVADLGKWGTLHVGRLGAVLVVGNEQDLVLDALTAGERKQGLLGEARIASAVAECKHAGVVMLVRPTLLTAMWNGQSFLARILAHMGTPRVEQFGQVPVRQFQFQIQVGGAGAQVVLPPPPGAAPAPQGAAQADNDRGFGLAPVLVSLTRDGGQVTLDARLTEGHPTLPRFLDYLVERGTEAGPFGQGAFPQPAIIAPAVPNIRQAIPALPVPQVPLPQPVPIQPPVLPVPPNQIEK